MDTVLRKQESMRLRNAFSRELYLSFMFSVAHAPCSYVDFFFYTNVWPDASVMLLYNSAKNWRVVLLILATRKCNSDGPVYVGWGAVYI